MKYCFLAVLLSIMLTSGCMSTNVTTTRTWEGRYSKIDNIKEAVNTIELEKGQSVWILSNDTLFQLLKNTQGK